MKTITIQIGNSDDKLTQRQWAAYVLEVRDCVEKTAAHIHFFGGSANYEPWQNVCCVLQIPKQSIELLIDSLKSIRERWRQDSVAVTIGDTTEFV